MRALATVARSLVQEEDGATLLEYGMLLFLIAMLCLVAVKSIGQKVSKGFEQADAGLP